MINVNEEEVNIELCKSHKKANTASPDTPVPDTCEITTCSDITRKVKETPWYLFNSAHYNKIVRIMAWILRFANNVSHLKNVKLMEEKLNAEEIDLAEKMIIKLAQDDSFDGSTGQRLRGLNVYLDEPGLIRVKTLICNRADTQGFKFLAVLNPRHEFTKIFIHHVHERLKHALVSTTMSS